MPAEKINQHSIWFDGVLGVAALLLIALTGWSIVSTLSDSNQQSELITTSKFVGVRTAPRVTETPGINAWVTLLLENTKIDSAEKAEFLEILDPSQKSAMPDLLKGYTTTLREANVADSDSAIKSYGDNDRQLKSLSAFRDIGVYEKPGFVAIATLQKSLKTRPKAPEEFCELLSRCQESLRGEIEINMGVGPLGKARLARVYLLDEFGNFYSHAFSNQPGRSRSEIISSEYRELQKNNLSPTYANNDFFFRFDFESPLDDQQTYSGIYLDQGGLGLVSTIAIPRSFQETNCVLALDIEFDLDWERHLQNNQALAYSSLIELGHENGDNSSWQPWNRFLDEVDPGNTKLHQALSDLAALEIQRRSRTERKSVYHQTTSGGADVVAIQVNRDRWLLFAVNNSRFTWPWLSIALTTITLSFLIYRIESGRKSANRSRQQAADQLAEKQNLLNTMRVPLMVSDPNTDQIVFCNDAAEGIGMSVGSVFGRDIVMDNAFAQSQYQKMQSASEESRRAYGIPIRVRQNEQQEERLAIIRSVAVTAPIDSLRADQRHRLGILFLINPDYDIGFLLQNKVQETKSQERRLLSGLLNHGLESLTLMLAETLKDSANRESPLMHWLADYISQRVNVVAWLMENWGQQPTLLDQRVLNRQTIEGTVQKYHAVFGQVKSDRKVRQQLHWNNGLLASSDPSPIIELQMDWPADIVFQIPKEGIFGFFVGEVLINAIKHGRPGSTIVIKVTHDPVRAELSFDVANERQSSSPVGVAAPGTYGGQSILQQISNLCLWDYIGAVGQDGLFHAQWTLNSIRSSSGGGD